jgi:hypothetical protein
MVENKKRAYGDYGAMKDAIGKITNEILFWYQSQTEKEMSQRDIFFIHMVVLKLLRAIKSDHYDSFLDLANYARLECIDKTKKDILDDLLKLRNMEGME